MRREKEREGGREEERGRGREKRKGEEDRREKEEKERKREREELSRVCVCLTRTWMHSQTLPSSLFRCKKSGKQRMLSLGIHFCFEYIGVDR